MKKLWVGLLVCVMIGIAWAGPTLFDQIHVTGTSALDGVVTASSDVNQTGATHVQTGTNGVRINSQGGTNDLPSVLSFHGNPNGVVSANEGSIVLDGLTPAVWVNTTSSTVWTQVGASVAATISDIGAYGDGFDGTVTADGTATVTCFGAPSSHVYTMTRDCEFASVTVNAIAVIKTNGFRILGSNTCTNNGTVQDNGQPGNSSSGGAARAAGFYPATNAGGTLASTGGTSAGFPMPYITANTSNAAAGAGAAAHGTGGNAGNGGICQGGGGGGGGGTINPSGAGGTGGNLGVWPANHGVMDALAWQIGGTDNVNQTQQIGMPVGGGGGNTDGNGVTATAGGGAGGGLVYVACKNMAGNGVFQALGGNGLGGGNGAVNNGGGGGSGGGGGGFVVLRYNHNLGTWTTSVAGGSLGTGGTGAGTGGNGGSGGTGGACVSVIYSGDGTELVGALSVLGSRRNLAVLGIMYAFGFVWSRKRAANDNDLKSRAA